MQSALLALGSSPSIVKVASELALLCLEVDAVAYVSTFGLCPGCDTFKLFRIQFGRVNVLEDTLPAMFALAVHIEYTVLA